MPFVPFHKFFPDVAKREVRTVHLEDHDEHLSAEIREERDEYLPADGYAMFELYCDEPGCDCRRVFFWVCAERQNKRLAVVSYGWESLDFYARWLNGAPVDPRLLKGPVLDIGSPQSKYAPALLSLIDEVLLADPNYIERLKRHYRMVRDVVEGTATGVTATAPNRRLDLAERKRILAAKTRELQARRSQKRRAR